MDIKNGKIDFDELEKRRDEARKKQAEAFHESLERQTANKTREAMKEAFAKINLNFEDKKRAAMEAEIKAKAAAAEAEIRARYEKENPGSWNESDTTKARRSLLQDINENQLTKNER